MCFVVSCCVLFVVIWLLGVFVGCVENWFSCVSLFWCVCCVLSCVVLCLVCLFSCLIVDG